jgi:ribonuclease R
VDEVLTGVMQVNPRRGRGFVDIGEAYDDLLVSRRDLGPALDGDTVEVEAWEGRTRRRARVLRVVSRGRTRLTGVLQLHEETATLRADDPRILGDVEVVEVGGARAGQAVLAQIIRYPEAPGDGLQVEVTRVLGEPGLLLTEVDKCLAGHGVEEPFPRVVEAAAGEMPTWVRASDKTDRLDLRDRHFVTIDPLNARDFDDAVAIEPGPDGTTRIWVAVADVSHYVEEGSPLDLEARRRGCSIYLPDRSIPMLPPDLSAGICSLVPRRDRLAMVVRLDVSRSGRIKQHACAAAVIHSRGQLDYRGVAAALSGDFEGKRSAYREHSDLLVALHAAAASLRRRRLRRGSLDLDLPEAQVLLDEDDPTRVRQIVQSRPDTPIKRAYSLVEELMVAANEAVARQFQRADVPTVWRIHPAPRAEALEKLAGWMNGYGVEARAAELGDERAIGRLVTRLRSHRAARPLSYLVLRTLKQATYAAHNAGHFGLASRSYLHFTSPIRRYPDLHVHRLLKNLLRRQGEAAGRPPPARQEEPEALQQIAREATACERRAIEVEREIHRVYASSLMRDRIGERLWGQIGGLNAFGFFVTLDEPYVEGLVKAESLERELELDPAQMRLFGRDRVFSLGDRVLVRVTDTSVLRRQVDLELVPGEGAEAPTHEPDPAAPAPGAGRGGRRERRAAPRYARPGGGRRARRTGGRTERRGGRRKDRGSRRGGRGKKR